MDWSTEPIVDLLTLTGEFDLCIGDCDRKPPDPTPGPVVDRN